MSDKDYVTLRDYFEARIAALEKSVLKAENDLRDRTITAREDIIKRLDDGNKFRESLKDQAATFLTRGEYAVAHRAIEEKIQKLELMLSAGEARSRTSSMLTATLVSVAIGVVIFIVTHWILGAKP